MPKLVLGSTTITSARLGTVTSPRGYLGDTPIWPPTLKAPAGRLVYVSPTLIKFIPFNGNWITINGVERTIPSGGVSLAPTGLTPGTVYYLYAFMLSGDMYLLPTTVGHAPDPTTGFEVMTSDASNTLVGMARVGTGPAWEDHDKGRLVLSWFNKRWLHLYNNFSTNQTTASTTPVELTTAIRCYFLTWANEVVVSQWIGTLNTVGIGQPALTRMVLDGTGMNPIAQNHSPVTGGYWVNHGITAQFTASEAVLHYISLMGNVAASGPTITYSGGNLSMRIRG